MSGSFAAIIDAFGGPGAFAVELDIPASHARAMKARNSVAPAYWPRMIKKGRARGVSITEEMLVGIYSRRWPRTKRRSAA
jgi:hypothetical protein